MSLQSDAPELEELFLPLRCQICSFTSSPSKTSKKKKKNPSSSASSSEQCGWLLQHLNAPLPCCLDISIRSCCSSAERRPSQKTLYSLKRGALWMERGELNRGRWPRPRWAQSAFRLEDLESLQRPWRVQNATSTARAERRAAVQEGQTLALWGA